MNIDNPEETQPLLPSGMKSVYFPKGPFRIIKDEEYDEARHYSIKTNNRIFSLERNGRGKEIYEIHPVKLNGNPLDAFNKVYLTRYEHWQYNVYWKNLINQQTKF